MNECVKTSNWTKAKAEYMYVVLWNLTLTKEKLKQTNKYL